MNLEPPPLPPPTRPSSCHLHPDQPFTGFCASCLRERLAGLDPASNHRNPTSSTTASSALRAIFKAPTSTSKCSFPELRRSKSFSGARADGIPVVVEPQRKSCDVRVRNTLWSLFHQDDHNKGGSGSGNGNSVWGEIEQVPTSKNLNEGFDEVKEEIEEEEEEEEEGEGEIRVLETGTRATETVAGAEEYGIKEEEEEEDVKTMKDHIDLDSRMRNQTVEKRDLKEIAGSFWLAASVLSKKLQKWRRKKKRSRRSGRESAGSTVRVDKPASSSRHFRETQSEVADYGYGRRSCDTDPRFSLDAARMSFDDPRYSLDEPRASWDGYLIGRAGARMPFMSSVVEDAPSPVRRSDNQIPLEEPINSIDEDPPTMAMPGGSAQTRDYYIDSSSSSHRRRQNLERSTSTRRSGTASGDAEETMWISNSKVSPASMDYFLIADTIHSNPNSLHDDCSESFESAYRDAAAIAGKGSMKLRRWTKAWKILGLIHWRGSSKDGENDRSYSRGNVVERSLSGSWPELQREVNGVNGNLKGFTFDRKVLRSNSSVSWRSSLSNGMRSGMEVNRHSKKRREEIVLEQNRSARFSPGHFDNGLLRFYLTPLTSGRRNGGGLGKSRSKSSHSFSRSMPRLY